MHMYILVGYFFGYFRSPCDFHKTFRICKKTMLHIWMGHLKKRIIYTHTHAHTHTSRTNTHTHTHTHTHTPTYTHTRREYFNNAVEKIVGKTCCVRLSACSNYVLYEKNPIMPAIYVLFVGTGFTVFALVCATPLCISCVAFA